MSQRDTATYFWGVNLYANWWYQYAHGDAGIISTVDNTNIKQQKESLLEKKKKKKVDTYLKLYENPVAKPKEVQLLSLQLRQAHPRLTDILVNPGLVCYDLDRCGITKWADRGGTGLGFALVWGQISEQASEVAKHKRNKTKEINCLWSPCEVSPRCFAQLY